MLYIVATPIGNLNEISPRCQEVLSSVDAVFAEDTRVFWNIKQKLGLTTPVISLHEHNEASRYQLLKEKAQNGNIALVSDAGMPLISDPGYFTIKKLIEEGIKVSAISGPCAAINALVCSGLDSTHFYFHGFLQRGKENHDAQTLKKIPATLIIYEGKSRVVKTLEILLSVLGNRKMALARELTKMHEEVITGTISEVLAKADCLKGEFVFVIEGNYSVEKDDKVKQLVAELKKNGLSRKTVADIILKIYNVGKKEVWDYYINAE